MSATKQKYVEETSLLVENLRGRGLLVEVDGLGTVEEVFACLFAALDNHLQGR